MGKDNQTSEEGWAKLSDPIKSFIVCRKCKGTFYQEQVSGHRCPLCSIKAWVRILMAAEPLIASAARATAEMEARAFYGLPSQNPHRDRDGSVQR